VKVIRQLDHHVAEFTQALQQQLTHSSLCPA
jgi:hypothetical protein